MRSGLPWLLGQTESTLPIWQGIDYQAAVDPPGTPKWLPGSGQPFYNAGVVQFEYTGQAQQVAVAGEFNGWDPTHPAYQLEQLEPGYFVGEVPLRAGSYRYKYVIDGQWLDPVENQASMYPLPSALVRNGFGTYDAQLELK